MVARDQVGVLALPAEPRRLGQRLFHDRRGIDENLRFAAQPADDELRQMLQFSLDHIMIVAIPGVDGNVAAIAQRERRKRIVRRRVGHADNHDAARRRPKRLRMTALFRTVGEPGHLAMLSGIEKGREPFTRTRLQMRRRKTAGNESQFGGFAGNHVSVGKSWFRHATRRNSRRARLATDDTVA